MEMDGKLLLEELSNIHDRCHDLIDKRDSSGFSSLTEEYLGKTDGVDKLNMLKTIMVATKGVPDFFPEIAKARQDVKDKYMTLHFEITGSVGH